MSVVAEGHGVKAARRVFAVKANGENRPVDKVWMNGGYPVDELCEENYFSRFAAQSRQNDVWTGASCLLSLDPA